MAYATPGKMTPEAVAVRTHRLQRMLWLVIVLGTGSRLLDCWVQNPVSYLQTDPARHWENAIHLFHPGLMALFSPILYQVFLWIVQQVTGERLWAMAIIFGVLSAFMPWVYYRASLAWGFSKNSALVIYALIVWLPSLTMIYHLLMPETILLPLIGGLVWACAVCRREPSPLRFLLVIFLGMLACLTKLTALPVALVAAAYSWHRSGLRIGWAAVALALVALMMLPNSIRTYRHLGYAAPFGSSWINMISLRSNAKSILIHWGDEYSYFSSPSCNVEPFWPFSHWHLERADSARYVVVNTSAQEGDKAWRQVYDALPFSWHDWLRERLENAVFLLFSPSWPDRPPPGPLYMFFSSLSLIWGPVILYVVAMDMKEFFCRRFTLISLSVVALFLCLFFQNAAIMEGRYRKPLEPLLIMNLFYLRQERLKKKEASHG